MEAWKAQGSCRRLVQERAATLGLTEARRSVWALFILGPDTPRKPGRGMPPDWGPAKRICHGCPVRRTCLDWALTQHDQEGVAGGLTAYERLVESDRRKLRRVSARRLKHAS